MSAKQKIYKAVLEGRHHAIREYVSEALDKKINAAAIIKEALYPAIAEIGERFG